MTKSESQIMKGVAILMMLFLHLFNRTENIECCTPLLYIGNTPLLVYLMRAVNPVPLYLLLSGYGLYVVNKKGDNNRWTRLFRLLLTYWMITGFFVIVGCFVKSDIYPGSIIDIITNILTVRTSYNNECWFLFPFILLSLTSPLLFKACDRYNGYLVFSVGFALEFLCLYIISRYGDKFLYNNLWVYKPFQYFQLMFPFVLGSLCAKYSSIMKPALLAKLNGGGKFAIFILVVFVRCFLDLPFIHTIYSLALLICILNFSRSVLVDSFLSMFGKQSTYMWMIHTWFCYYLFHDYIYWFKYPLIIYIVLVVITFATSIVMSKAINKMTS